MYTVIKARSVGKQPQSSGQPRPEVIDHRRGEQGIQRGTSWVENIPYKTLKYQRDALLESEIVYKKQLKDLQKDKDDLLKVYEPTCEENKYLRSIIKHGPDAVKLKKLSKAKRDLEFELDRLKAENKRLSGQMKTLQTAANSQTRDELLERQWQTILTSQSKAELKEVEKTSKDETNNNDDDLYDLQLDTVKKSIQILLNNVTQLQREKKKVDYALTTRKGAIVGNESLHKAIKERLDKDLEKFKDHVTAAENKTSELQEKFTNHEKRMDENIKDIDQQKQQQNELDTHQQNQQEHHEKEQLQQQEKQSSTLPKPQLTRMETTIVKSRFATVETQTDMPQDNYLSSNETKTRGYKKKKRPSVESRAIQTEAPDKAEKDASPPKPVKSYKSAVKKTTSETVSKTQRRLEYAEKLITNRSSDGKADIVQEYDVAKPENTSRVKGTPSVNNKSESNQTKTSEMLEKETDGKQQHNLSKKVVNGPHAKDETNNLRNEQTKSKETKIKSKSIESKSIVDESENGKYKNVSTKGKNNNKNTRTQGRDTRVKSKSVERTVESSEKDDFRDKIIDKLTLPKITSSRFIKPSHDPSNRSDHLQSLPDIRKPDTNKVARVVRQIGKSNGNKPKQRPRSASTIEESRSYSDSGIYYSKVGRSDTPLYNGAVPEFEYVVQNEKGNIRYKGKPVSDYTQSAPREDAYNEVLYDLMNQQRHEKTNVVHEFNKTLETQRDTRQPMRTMEKRSPSIDEDSLASQSLHSSHLLFNTRGKDVSETEMKVLTHR
ncbi:hypothetical protein ACF0H5_000330 [Mactra antiquata]